MKTIYEKLNPDILASINADEQKYPYATKALKTKLKSEKFWTSLQIDTIQMIITHSHESFLTLSYQDIMWGDKFLVNGEDKKAD